MLLRLVLALHDEELEKQFAENLTRSDVIVECYGKQPGAIQKIVQSCADVIVVSESLLSRPVDSGIAMLNNLPETPTTVILHDYDAAREHAEIMAAGADVVLYSKVPVNILLEAIEATLESRQQLVQLDRFDRKGIVQPKLSDFVSVSDTMQIFINDVRQVAPSNSSLLILGETGVGKEHLAKAIHAESSRSNGPFVALNMSALPEQLLESELFGHIRGSFTGATRSRRGAFEQAHGGTIFLDEIGEMPLHLQTKLLRVLQDYEVRPIGSDKSIWVDVRIIAATNRDLDQEIQLGNFRKDLYYRLSVMTLKIPALRDRSEDIPALTRRFLNYYRYKIGKDVTQVAEPAMKALVQYEWPGNVRELMNVIERAMLICQSQEISIPDLPEVLNVDPQSADNFVNAKTLVPDTWLGKSLPQVRDEVIDQAERLYLQMVLEETNGRIGKAAEIAGIHSRALYNKMKRLGLKKENFK